MKERYFEDFVVGQNFQPTPRLRVEKADIIAFARQFDPQPFHLDEEAARKSIFGRLVASGWHTAAMELRIETEVLEARRSKSRPDWGLIKMRTKTLNQDGETVQEIVQTAFVPRRP